MQRFTLVSSPAPARAPTGSSPHWPAPGRRQCSLTTSNFALDHTQTSLAGHESLHSVSYFEQQGTFLVHASGRSGNSRGSQHYLGGPTAQSIERRPGAVECAEALSLELPQH